MKLIKKVMLFAIVFFFNSFSFAQKTATIKGSVLAAVNKAPLTEAVVTLTSPVLSGSKIALTDSLGNYQITGLPAGVYSITFEMEGFRTAGRQLIEITGNGTVGISIQMARTRENKKRKNKERIDYVNSKNGS